MLLTPNYNLKKPEGTDVVNIDDLNGNADIIDGKLKELNDNKAPKNVATTSANGLMSSTDKKKLDGVETGANKYTHPTSHPAAMITEDASHRFLTDAERKLIQAWETFKASGGTIGGDITLRDIFLSGKIIDVNGYTKLPNKIIIQWGAIQVTGGVNGVEVILPISFTTNYRIVAAPVDLALGQTPITTWITGKSNTQFWIRATSNCSVQWIAIGY